MNDEHDTGVAQLLERALPDRPADPHGLVAGAMTRGRARRRRHQAGTAVAALAVFGVIGAVAAVVPSLSEDDSRPTQVASGGATAASDPTGSPSTASTSSALEPTAITISSQEVPAAVVGIVGRQGAGPLRSGAEGPKDTADQVVAHFDWQGTLTTLIVEKVTPNTREQCDAGAQATRGTCATNAGGDLQLTWGPSLADGVTAQGVSVWRGVFEVSTLSYNAAEGKDVAPLTAAPPLSLDDLTALATSDVWFE